jgi:DNA invertase Pin-like site-specific DNA recombinase
MDKIFTYFRVSTDLQDVESQKSAVKSFLKNQDVQIIHEFIDLGFSGKKGVERPAFNEMLSRLNEVDGVCLFDYDRLTRDEERGVMLMYEIRSKQKKIYEARTGMILTFEPMTERLLTFVKSMLAEEERKKILDRQASGIKAYKERNGRWGRKKKKLNIKKYEEYQNLGLSKTAIAKLFGMTVPTLKKIIKENKIESN